jgi:hypothetical protein
MSVSFAPNGADKSNARDLRVSLVCHLGGRGLYSINNLIVACTPTEVA